jgi:hypothetical protein
MRIITSAIMIAKVITTTTAATTAAADLSTKYPVSYRFTDTKGEIPMRKNLKTKDTPAKAKAVVKAAAPIVPALGQANPWLQISNAMDDVAGLSFMKFQKDGTYTIGVEDDVVPIGTKAIAHVEDVEFGHRKWVDGMPVNREMGRVADGYKPKRRNELDDNDKSFWEQDPETGKSIDPWKFWSSIPITLYQTGEKFLLESGSKGLLYAIRKVVKTYGLRMQYTDGDRGQMLVELQRGKYKHSTPTYGWIWFPVLQRAGWIDPDGKVLPDTDGDEDDQPRARVKAA